MRSMTGYGKAEINTPLARFTAEIQSLNRRHFELNSYLPRQLGRFETAVREIVSTIHRGQLTYRLEVVYHVPPQIEVNMPLLRTLKEGWVQMAELLGYPSSSPMPIEFLTTREGLWCEREPIVDENTLWSGIELVTREALARLIEVKGREGQKLSEEIVLRCKTMVEIVHAIQERAPAVAERYRQQLTEKMRALLSESQVGQVGQIGQAGQIDEERLWRETCLFADKSDVAEEISRLLLHLEQLEALARGEMTSVGKQLEFLLQEIGREVNTLGTKGQDSAMVRFSLALKAEAEKIREQIQNIE